MTNVSNSKQDLQANQEDLLKKSKIEVKNNATLMKKSLDKNQLTEGLKHASNMLSEMCTSILSPKSYYELYMLVTDELRHLEMFLLDEFQKGLKCDDLYEVVQYTQAIIPRLYLLITIGTVYIKTKEYPRRIILRDLVEMCRGVQHPLRGLFLRNYLLQCTKNLLPDIESSTKDEQKVVEDETIENNDGTILDSIDFISLNFSEMNKLWVRMQYQGHTRFKEKREQERKELRLLVGTNLVRLSQLECMTSNLYTSIVLPKVLEQLVNCNDAIAQEYLMECIIQVFPDEFHMQTLEVYLKSFIDLHEDVNVKNVLISLLERFSKFLTDENRKIFEIFCDQIKHIVAHCTKMPQQDIIALYSSLLNLSIKCFKDKLDYADQVLESTREQLTEKIQYNTPVSKELIKILKVPIDLYKNILVLLKLQNYAKLYEKLDYVGRKQMCINFINSAIENENYLQTPEEVESFLQILSPLVNDSHDKPSDYEQDPEDFMDEQTLVAKLVHLFKTDDLDQQFIIFRTAAKLFNTSGRERMQYTLASIIFESYKLAHRYKVASAEDSMWDKKCDKIFKFCFQNINQLIKAQIPVELTFRLFIQGSLALAEISYDNSENITYEFISQAINLYDEEITSNQYQAVTQIISTCERILHVFGEENCDALRHNCVTRSAKLLKKPDQCRAVALCSHLFWLTEKRKDGQSLKNEQKVNECLKKCLKICSQCVDLNAQLELQCEILTWFVYYYENKNEKITIDMLKELVQKVREDASQIDDTQEKTQIMHYFDRTLKHMNTKLNEKF